MDEPVFVFGLTPDADRVLAFATVGEAQAFLSSYLGSAAVARKVFRARLSQSQLVIYTIRGQPLVLAKPGRFGVRSLIEHGLPDDAGLQVRLDSYAARRGLSLPVADRVALANQLMREHWERMRETPPPMPRWLAKRMPEPRTEPPQIQR